VNALVGGRQHLERVAVRREGRDRLCGRGGVVPLGLDEPVLDREVRDRRAEVRAQARRPALEVVQRGRELLPLRLAQLELGALAVADRDLVHPLPHE
jgi:hypothetical protein